MAKEYQPLSFVGVVPEKFERFKTNVSATGTLTAQNDGSWRYEGYGIKANATYNPTTQALIVTPTHLPFLVSEQYFAAHMKEALK